MSIIPKLNGETIYGHSTYDLCSPLRVNFGLFEQSCALAFSNRTGYELIPTDSGSEADILLIRDEKLRDEEYRLTVTADGITIFANRNLGVTWALTTIHQLLNGEGNAPFCQIHDYPKYSHRGLSLDCARHFFPANEVKKIIEQMSLVKMNVLHWHLTDDQGWRIESKRFPSLHETNGQKYFTQEEIKDVIEFAAVRGIEVVPEVDLPGHTSAILAAYPEYSCSGKQVELATKGGIFPIILCPGKDQTLDFVEALLDEICSLFPSTRIHIGGDEAPKSEWEKCEHCRRRMHEHGLQNTKDLQGYISVRLSEFLASRGKTAVFWSDSLEASNFPLNNPVQFWSVQFEEHISPFINNGGKVIISDMFGLYFDYPYSMSSLKKVYDFKPEIAEQDYSAHPNLLGLEACIWSEHITDAERLEQLLFPRLFAVAEITWTNDRDYDDFLLRLPIKLAELEKSGIHYTSLENCNPVGEGRLQETLAYMGKVNSNLNEGTAAAVAPSPSFMKNFRTKFFEPSDLPVLAKLFGGEKKS